MTREEIAIKLAKDPAFKQLAPDRQKAVFEASVSRADFTPTQEEPPLGPLARNPAWQTLVSRPAAQYRGFIRGLAPGGETPRQGLERGALAQGQDLAQRARGFNIQQPMIERYYQSIAERNPGQSPNIAQIIGGLVPSAVGLAGEMGANIASNPIELASVLAPFTRAGQMATGAIASSRPGQAIGRFLNQPIGRRAPTDVPTLLSKTERQVAKLPPQIRDIFIRERRAQLAQQMQMAGQDITTASYEAKITLNNLNRETLHTMREETVRLKQQLQDQGFQVALKLKTTDIGPLMKAQSTRYGDVVRSVIGEADDAITVTSQEMLQAMSRRFENNPRAFNLAHGQLQLETLDQYSQPVLKVYRPSEVLAEIDRLGVGIPRSPTQTYTYADDVADELRDILLTEIERKGQVLGKDFTKIRAAKQDWKAWKPVQKRLVSGTRFFEQSETVTDQFVQKLTQYAYPTHPKNVDKYFEEIQKYIGYDFAKPMRPIIDQLTAIERKQLALEVAKVAEQERIMLQMQAGKYGVAAQERLGESAITNMEIRLKEQATRSQKMWGLMRKLGYVGGGLYGLKELQEAIR